MSVWSTPRKTKLLLATPCYGGLLTSQYAGSLLLAGTHFRDSEIDLKTLFLSNESLIPRARNKIMHLALEGDYDKLLFIDADIGFTPGDIEALLETDLPIIGGTYPAKEYPLRLVFGLDPELQVDMTAPVVEVKYVPTGFLLIDLKTVRERLKAEPFRAEHPFTKQECTMHDYFPSGIRDGVYESEDWGFCTLARKSGLRIHLHTGVVLTHIGTHTFIWENLT